MSNRHIEAKQEINLQIKANEDDELVMDEVQNLGYFINTEGTLAGNVKLKLIEQAQLIKSSLLQRAMKVVDLFYESEIQVLPKSIQVTKSQNQPHIKIEFENGDVVITNWSVTCGSKVMMTDQDIIEAGRQALH